MNKKDKNQIIKALSEIIKEKFHPERVILFGSYAYGSPLKESDVDLLIIMNTSLSVREEDSLIRRELKSPLPLDVIVRTPQQIKERIEMGDFFIRKAVQDGIVL